MINKKQMGEYCTYVKQYVPITVEYLSDGSSTKSCGNSMCGNSKCDLCDSFTGNKIQGKDELGHPEHDIE